jgi:phosphohistidine phosphatase
MDIYLLRHGAADQQSPTGKDADRGLTIRGASDLRRTLKAAQTAGMQPSLILSSPYARALESAQLAARLLKYSEPILKSNSLLPDSTPADVWNELRTHRDARSVLVVSHEPLLSATASWMLGATRVNLEFAPGMIARIDVPDLGAEPKGVLRRVFVWNRP